MTEFPGGVSVILPVYNGEAYLSTAVQSVLNQTYDKFELLIIDDGSTDGSALLAENFGDKRIRVIRKQHTGLADSLNTGLRIAEGKWIARLDADDIAVTKRLELQADHIGKNPEANVVAGHSAYFSGDGKIEFTFTPPSENEVIKNMLNVHNPINHSVVTFEKNVILQNGGYDESLDCFEDFELWLRLRDKLTFSIIPENLGFTRMRNDSMTSNASYEKIYDILQNNLKKLEANGIERGQLDEIRFRIEYFYGDRSKARSSPGKINSIANIGALLSTLLPDESFRKVRDSRVRYRLAMSRKERDSLSNELSKLLKQ